MSETIYDKAKAAATKLGVSTEYLRREAERGNLPEGSVLATLGGHHSYNTEAIMLWMQENYKRQTKVSRMEAKA